MSYHKIKDLDDALVIGREGTHAAVDLYVKLGEWPPLLSARAGEVVINIEGINNARQQGNLYTSTDGISSRVEKPPQKEREVCSPPLHLFEPFFPDRDKRS